MVCGLPYWNVSVRLEEDHDPTQIAGLVRLTVGNMKLMMPFLTAHRDALFRGLPLTKNMKPLADEEEEAIMADVRNKGSHYWRQWWECQGPRWLQG